MASRYEQDLLEIACEDKTGALQEEMDLLGDSSFGAVDLGCGPGSLLSFLANRFREVIAVDYSEKFLEAARVRCRRGNVVYACHDLSLGEDLPFQAEVVCCVNALIDPDRERREGMLRSLTSVLTKNGVAVIVVPAFESVFHVYHSLRRIRDRAGKPEGLSAGSAEKLLTAEVISFAEGIVRVGGVATKYWMREELIATLAEQNLRVQKVRRVEYNWDEEIENVPPWLNGARPWDWLVVCG